MKIDLLAIPVLMISRVHKTPRLMVPSGQFVLNGMSEEGAIVDHTPLDVTIIKSIAIDPQKGQGCATGHILASGVAQLSAGPVLVLEEDVRTTPHLQRYLDIPEDADAVHLNTSCHPKGGLVWTPVSDELVRHRNMLSNHAILHVTKRYTESLIEACSYAILNVVNSDVMRVNIQIERRLNIYGVRKPWFVKEGKLEHDTSHEFIDP